MIDEADFVGSVQLAEHEGRRVWVIECESDVMMRLKRVFERIPKAAVARAPLVDNPVNAKELRWFLSGFPMRISESDLAYLNDQADSEVSRQRALNRVLKGTYEPTKFNVAVEPWDFQPLPAELTLASGGVLCADEVGLGKTMEGALLISDPRARPAAVVCPSHLVSHWKTKLAEYLPGIRVHAVRSTKPYPLTEERRGRTTVTVPFPDVIIVSISKLIGWASALTSGPGPVIKSVVYDEIHNFCHEENAQGQMIQKYAAALHLRDHVPYRMGLSGTPIANYGGEVRVVMNVLLPDALGTKQEFGREHCGGSTSEKAKVKDPEALQALMVRRGLMTNRTRKDVDRFGPPVKTFTHPVAVDMAQLDRVKVDTLHFAETLLRRGVAPEDKRHAAREIDWRLRHATGLAKAPAVIEFVSILAGRGPVVLFGFHQDFWRKMAWGLRDFNPVFYTGEQSPRQKERAVAAFLAGDSRVFCMSLRAGEGVDGLQRVCSTCVIGELDWSWTRMMKQNIGRLAREGQTQDVFNHVLIADEGADPHMADALGVKRGQFEGIFLPGGEGPEEVQTDPNHVKELARAWLSKHDPRALRRIEDEIRAAEDAKVAEKEERAAKRSSKRRSPAPDAQPALDVASVDGNDDYKSAPREALTPVGRPADSDGDVACNDGNAGPATTATSSPTTASYQAAASGAPWAHRLRPSRRSASQSG